VGDILSQSEIDRLLAQLNAGELDVKEIAKDTSEKRYAIMISGVQANLPRITSEL
jgi:hypothetical protein